MPAAAAAKADNPVNKCKTVSCGKKEAKKKNKQRTEENLERRNRRNPWEIVDERKEETRAGDPEEEEEVRDWI